jgi:hypothetical protein
MNIDDIKNTNNINNINNINKINNINNRISLDPEIWGGKGWFFLDSICLAYPDNPTEEEKKQYKNFFYAMPIVGPCNKCRQHYKKFINKYPLNDTILKSKENLILWILSAHNNVRKINNQKQISLKEFYEFYNNIYKTDVKLVGCKDKCELTTLPDKMFKTKEHMKQDSHIESYTKQNSPNNFFSLIFFGVIIALSLFMYRSIQLKINRKIIR